MVFQLTDELVFPDPALAEPDGWLAVGGDLSINRLLLAYQNGIFPWYADDEPIYWYSPHERCVIFPQDVFVSKSMQHIFDKNVFEIKMNTNFESVIENCKSVFRKGQDGTWITPEMKAAYIQLHNNGFANSVEVYQKDKLVGGLYGVVINKVFCGESMFSTVSNASKAALIWLCRQPQFQLIDCQLPNKHLHSMGAVIIGREEYMRILNRQTL
ncbi:MAG: leucyl/phenylalanyl-tRNA--protein transferase [Ferruginibacter sp.]